MKKNFADFICDNFTDEEYVTLRKLKRRKRTKSNPSLYKIVITADRWDYDDLSELADHPEKGFRVGTFYFYNPNQLDLIVKAFEGSFYQLFLVDETERVDGGVLEDSVFEYYWWDKECCGVCECCFLRKDAVDGKWACRKENV